jgi:glycosyltransferase involved in cell wall biosynthesis
MPAARSSSKPRVVIVRGHQVTPWELAPWELLADRFDVRFLLTEHNGWDIGSVSLPAIRIRALRDLLPGGRIADLAVQVAGDRYLKLSEHLESADIVHAEELSYWFAAEAARAKAAGGRFRLVQTVWETLPMLEAFRNPRARRFRAQVLAQTDLFLPGTERARDALLLEGVDPARMQVCPPGIDLDRFARAAAEEPEPDPNGEHVLISPGRLVWEKGHQDVLRAVAALHRGLVTGPDGARFAPRVLMVGRGPEEARLLAHARELGIGDAVEIQSVSYDDMPALYGRATALVLASLPQAGSALHPLDIPRAFWEEQFGYVLAEAIGARLPIVTTLSGAIPEVTGGAATYVAPGDWMGLARALAAGPLAQPPGTRAEYPADLRERYALRAGADRLAAAYQRVLERPS